MTTAVIGRILATSLYQAISEQLPLRVEFYESWLSPKGFTARRVYLSGVRAVFSFLRREEAGYDAIVRRAGDLAANWLFDDLPPLRRRLMLALPRGLRMRAALSLARSFVKETWSQSEVKVRSGREASTVTITGSIFCDVRAAAPDGLVRVLCGGPRGHSRAPEPRRGRAHRRLRGAGRRRLPVVDHRGALARQRRRGGGGRSPCCWRAALRLPHARRRRHPPAPRACSSCRSRTRRSRHAWHGWVRAPPSCSPISSSASAPTC